MPEVPKTTSSQCLLQYLKKNMKDEVDFLPADKRQRFLQVDTIILGVCGQASQITQNNKFAISL